MHGGMKIYAGAPSAARHYVEAGRGRADDYYLAEGTGIARRYAAAGGGRVQELAALAGDDYEAWVAGLDPDTGTARGRLRTDERAVRFVEVVVNGPQSWSLAAALHPTRRGGGTTRADSARSPSARRATLIVTRPRPRRTRHAARTSNPRRPPSPSTPGGGRRPARTGRPRRGGPR